MARHFGRSEARVRYWIKRSLAHGFAALADQPHVGQPSRLTPALLATLRQELEKGERTWSAAQLAAWLAEHHGVQLSARHGGRLLQRARLSYKRTERGLNHKRHPQQVQEKQTELVAREKGAKPVAWTSAL
jgi:transposase